MEHNAIPKKPKLYALLVAINKYPRESFVRNLYGCENDISKMNAWLEEHAAEKYDLEICTLRNEEATKEQVIREFERHLGKATPSDTVFFMYAGHGSQQLSAEEFSEYYNSQMDETLVCYNSRLDNGQDLADKELAVLISRIGARHVLVVLDCCHSGSGTRDTERPSSRIRTAPIVNRRRMLSTYLDGYYIQQRKTQEKISIPSRTHILLAACSPMQKAAEHAAGYGIFSHTLLEVLKGQGKFQSYQDLFLRCNIAIRTNTFVQTPQFECYGGADPHAAFLEIGPAKSSNFPPFLVYEEAKRFFIDFGALHGMVNHAKQLGPINLKANQALIGQASLRAVGPERSEIVLPRQLSIPKGISVQADLLMFLQPPTLLQVDASPQVAHKIQGLLPQALNIAIIEDALLAHYQIVNRQKRLELWDLHTHTLIQHTLKVNIEGMEALYAGLKAVLTWQRFKKLANAPMENRFADIEVTFDLFDANNRKVKPSGYGFDFPFYGSGESDLGYFPVFKVRNHSQETVFANLFYLSRHYGIEPVNSVLVTPGSQEVTLLGRWDGDGLYLAPNILENTDIFKVLLSAEPLHSWQIVQPGIVVRGIAVGSKRDYSHLPKSAIGEWVAQTFAVTLHKFVGKIGSQPLQILDSGISINAHPTVTAEVLLASTRNPQCDNLNGLRIFHEFSTSEWKVVPLAKQEDRMLDQLVIRNGSCNSAFREQTIRLVLDKRIHSMARLFRLEQDGAISECEQYEANAWSVEFDIEEEIRLMVLMTKPKDDRRNTY
jgi:hypothetical protein